MSKKIIKVILSIFIVILFLAIGVIGWLTVTEYNPSDVVTLDVNGTSDEQLNVGDTITVMTWNLGYGALGDNADFFMDGGTSVTTASKERVLENTNRMMEEIQEVNPDIAFFQEIDIDSHRSHHVNQVNMFQEAFEGKSNTFAYNFNVNFIPYPIPPLGRVKSGLYTMSDYAFSSAERIALPCPFTWPIRVANLKRCLMINRISLENSDNELVLINLHLEAYDDGEGKLAQTQMLKEILEEETAKGNYVIAGGDFNQYFSNADFEKYPAQEGMWLPGEVDVSMFNDTLQFLMDSSTPTCRSLDKAYENADEDSFQFYLIDGFIVSNNIKVNALETIDLDFENSDHNPIVINLTLE